MSAIRDVRISVSRASPDIKIGIRNQSQSISLDVQKGGSQYPLYTGEYVFTPQDTEQIVLTKKKALLENIRINPIPNNYGLITYNGAYLTVS